MSTVTSPPRYTPGDLLKMPDGDRYELVNGQLVERTMSAWSSYVGGELHARVRDYCQTNKAGWPLPEGTSYQCFRDNPSCVRKADVSFIEASRMSLAQATAEGYLTIVPDLAVEVLSPNDLAYEVDEKVQEFLRAGARLVWVVNPQAHTVEVHRPRGTGTILRETDELDGEDVLPGFRCRVGDLFVPPAGVALSS
jgi:Uma2 family endonuclease